MKLLKALFVLMIAVLICIFVYVVANAQDKVSQNRYQQLPLPAKDLEIVEYFGQPFLQYRHNGIVTHEVRVSAVSIVVRNDDDTTTFVVGGKELYTRISHREFLSEMIEYEQSKQ